jgi:hypothetical protein
MNWEGESFGVSNMQESCVSLYCIRESTRNASQFKSPLRQRKLEEQRKTKTEKKELTYKIQQTESVEV